MRRDDIPFRVINVANAEVTNANEVYGVMFDSNGIIYNKVLEQGNEIKKPVQITPINAAVKVSSVEQEVGREVLEDYEITYAGMANGEIRLLYRENAGSSPGLTQELTYPADSQSIRFKTIKIKLHKVTAESLIYEVEGQ